MPSLNTFLKLSLLYLLLLFITIGISINVFYEDIKPSVQQASEETMVDSVNLLAEIVTPYFVERDFDLIHYANERYRQRNPDAKIWSHQKESADFEFYITDKNGIVLYNSADTSLIGTDYSGWRDVKLTLEGGYGARTTRLDPDNEWSSQMHVAAPILIDGEIAGAVTLIKPYSGIRAFIGPAETKVTILGGILLAILMTIGLYLVYRFNDMLNQLSNYVDKVRRGQHAEKLRFEDPAFDHLADTLHRMRQELDGKDYVEHYVHTLTHELKTPLAAISAAAQILENDISPDKRTQFVQNIEAETLRLKNLIERLLLLASIENNEDTNFRKLDLKQLVSDEIKALEALLAQKNLTLQFETSDKLQTKMTGDEFLLRMAIRNLLDNAIDFSDPGSELNIRLGYIENKLRLVVTNQGELIPDYAFNQIFEKFFSRPRAQTGRKSSGLGLCLVKEIAQLHHGDIQLSNFQSDEGQGVNAELTLATG